MEKQWILYLAGLIVVIWLVSRQSDTSRETDLLTDYIARVDNSLSKSTRRDVAKALVEASLLDPEIRLPILVGIAHTESHFNPKAAGQAGDSGLMQVTKIAYLDALKYRPNMVKLDDWQNIYDPYTNVRVATAYLSRLRAIRPTMREVLEIYNGGFRNPNPAYATLVLGRTEQYKQWRRTQ